MSTFSFPALFRPRWALNRISAYDILFLNFGLLERSCECDSRAAQVSRSLVVGKFEKYCSINFQTVLIMIENSTTIYISCYQETKSIWRPYSVQRR